MMLKMSLKDILRMRTFSMIAIVSGFILGIMYYFLMSILLTWLGYIIIMAVSNDLGLLI